MDSERREVCSGGAPWREGREARASFSTCCFINIHSIHTFINCSGRTYRNLKIDRLIRNRTHLIIKAKLILPLLIGRKHIITLSFFLSIKYDLPAGRLDAVIDVEGATRLHGKVEGCFRALFGDPAEEAGFFVGDEFVG